MINPVIGLPSTNEDDFAKIMCVLIANVLKQRRLKLFFFQTVVKGNTRKSGLFVFKPRWEVAVVQTFARWSWRRTNPRHRIFIYTWTDNRSFHLNKMCRKFVRLFVCLSVIPSGAFRVARSRTPTAAFESLAALGTCVPTLPLLSPTGSLRGLSCRPAISIVLSAACSASWCQI